MADKIGQAQIQKWKDQNPDAAREATLKGSKRGNQVKSEKATFKKLLQAALEAKDDSGLSNKEKMVYTLIEKAISGAKDSNKAFEIIRDTVGEQLTQQIEVSSKDKINIKIDGNKSESE